MKATVTREGDVVSFRVQADGFLYNMVRIMVGTLAAVAAGRMTPEDVLHALQARDRALAGSTAPACGLYLDRVYY
jgi:tRNA pseudouridine38-40 synthase